MSTMKIVNSGTGESMLLDIEETAGSVNIADYARTMYCKEWPCLLRCGTKLYTCEDDTAAEYADAELEIVPDPRI